MPRALSNALPPLLSALFSTRENHSRRQPHRSCTHRPTPASSFQASPFFPPSLNKHRIKVETVFGEERRLPFASKIFEDFLRFEKFAFTISCSRSPGRIFSSHVSSSRAYFTITTLIRETRPVKRESSRRQPLVIHLIDLSAGSNLARAEHDDHELPHNCSSPDDLKVTEE